jgi:acetyl esterase/lipase
MKTLLCLLALAGPVLGEEWKNLWPQDAPGAARPPAGSEKVMKGGGITNIEVPQYMACLPAPGKTNGAAVVILPGGGYQYLAAEHEGHAYALWLAGRGIAGIVVKYRVSENAAAHDQFPVPFLDARRAIRTVRANAATWGINPKKIGVMGSSAGGHLASLCATRFADTFPQEGHDPIDRENCRPDFAILIYPVISMDAALTHAGSRLSLLGANPSDDEVARCSTERAVTRDTPPVFLLSTSDDWVDCRNSLQFAAACKEHGVPFSLHLFEQGGHGYGLHGKGPLAAWPELLDTWLRARLAP